MHCTLLYIIEVKRECATWCGALALHLNFGVWLLELDKKSSYDTLHHWPLFIERVLYILCPLRYYGYNCN